MSPWTSRMDLPSPRPARKLTRDSFLMFSGRPATVPQHEEVELAWKILDPVLDFWAESNTPPCKYPAGSWGPSEADEMIARDGFVWRRP